MRPHTLVAGIGNIFLGDDGFGCEVVARLGESDVPEGVRVVDYGIRGMHLAYDLLDGWDLLILVDALPDRGAPGRLEIIEVRPEHLGIGDLGVGDLGGGVLNAHGMAPVEVLSSLGAWGGRLPPTVLVGVQVADVGDRIGLSAQVGAAVPAAVDAIRALLQAPRVPAPETPPTRTAEVR